MGQLVSVRERHSSNPGVVRFEINRSLTGMGHERYGSPDDIVLDRPVDTVARRLFDHGGVQAVHVNSSVITVYLAGGNTGDGLAEVIENLFRFYGDEDDAEVADPDEPQAQEPPAQDASPEDAAEVRPAEEPAGDSSDAGVDTGEVDGDVPEA